MLYTYNTSQVALFQLFQPFALQMLWKLVPRSSFQYQRSNKEKNQQNITIKVNPAFLKEKLSSAKIKKVQAYSLQFVAI